VIVDLESGAAAAVRTPADGSEANDRNVSVDGQQYRFHVPDGAKTLYVRYQNDALSVDTVLLLRYNEPSLFTENGLATDFIWDTGGGFQDLCLSGSEVVPGDDLFLWIFTDGGSDNPAVGNISVTADACTASLAPGETVREIAPALEEAGSRLLSARQIVVAVGNAAQGLKLTLTAAEKPEDLDFYVRLDSPVEIDGDGNVVADFRAETAGTDPEEIVIPCDAVVAGDYYVAVGNPNRLPVVYDLSAVWGESGGGVLFVRGNVNVDERLNIADAVFLLGHLFGNTGPLPCPDAGDANDDGRLNIADAIAILGHLFGGAGDLPLPFGEPGADPTDDELDCPCFPPAGFPCGEGG